MTPIQKAKEIIVAFNNFYLEKPITATVERFLESEQAAALLSGEDWKEDDGKQQILTSVFEKLKKDYDTLESNRYDKRLLKGYSDALWNLSLILKDEFGVIVKY